MAELDDFFAEVTRLVNAELDWLIPADGDRPQSLRDAIRWSLFGGGKHFRPALLIAAGRAFGASGDKLLRTPAAVPGVPAGSDADTFSSNVLSPSS